MWNEAEKEKESSLLKKAIESIHITIESIQSGQNRFVVIRKLSIVVSIKDSLIARDSSCKDCEKIKF